MNMLGYPTNRSMSELKNEAGNWTDPNLAYYKNYCENYIKPLINSYQQISK